MKNLLPPLLALLWAAVFVLPATAQKRAKQPANDEPPHQLLQPKRVELGLEPNESAFTIISAEKDGLILVRETDEFDDQGRIIWDFIKYDTALHQDWRMTHSVKTNHQFTGYDYYDGHMYFLYSKGQYSTQGYYILKVNLATQQVTTHDIKRIIPIELTDFQINGGTALFIGEVNYKPAILHYTFATDRGKVLPGIYTNLGELIEAKVDDDTRLLTVIMNERSFRRTVTFSLKTFDEAGNLIKKRRLNPGLDYSLLSGKSTTFSDNMQLVAGTYTQRRSIYSRGLFIARLDDDGQKDIHYFNYADLKNFFKYMRKKREERIKTRINKKKEKGKDVKFNYRVLVHEILERDGQYILIGEAYYPRYTAPYPYFAGLNADQTARRAARGLYTNFDGYRYTHAVLLAFDKQGNLLWDNSFEINDVVSYNLEQFVSVSVEENRIVLLYNYENVLRSKIIQGGEVIDGKVSEDIRLRYENDEVRKNEAAFSGLQYWYNDYFYAFGVQKIRNMADENVNLTREVFFINKVTYANE